MPTNYLRDRPFLVVTTSQHPAQHAKTHVAGWAANANNVRTVDRPEIVNRVTDAHLRDATVILDLMNTAVVKNRTGEGDTSVYNQHAAANARMVVEAVARHEQSMAQPAPPATPTGRVFDVSVSDHVPVGVA